MKKLKMARGVSFTFEEGCNKNLCGLCPGTRYAGCKKLSPANAGSDRKLEYRRLRRTNGCNDGNGHSLSKRNVPSAYQRRKSNLSAFDVC